LASRGEREAGRERESAHGKQRGSEGESAGEGGVIWWGPR
jgi:hypothetical protein